MVRNSSASADIAKINHAARAIERYATRLERAQTIHGGGDGKSQFLRFRAAGIVNDTSIGDREWSAKTVIVQDRVWLPQKFSTARSTVSGWRRRRQSRRSD